MNLGKLYDSYTTPDTDFLRLYQQTDLGVCKTINEAKESMKKVFTEADIYATNNRFEYKYFQLAKKPLYEEFNEIEPRHFILKGFDAYVSIDLTESLDNIKPYVIVKNDNVKNLEDGQRIDIDDEFIKSLNPLQRDIFLEALGAVETDTVQQFQKVWGIEQSRIDKWVKTCKINLKGNK